MFKRARSQGSASNSTQLPKEGNMITVVAKEEQYAELASISLARQSASATSREKDYSNLATVGLSREDHKVLKAVSFSPSVTINVLQNRLPEVECISTVRSLTKRALLHRYRSVYSLTYLGSMLLHIVSELSRQESAQAHSNSNKSKAAGVGPN
jgi:hypothetical protein